MQNKAFALADSTLRLLGWRCVCACVCVRARSFPFAHFESVVYAEKRLGQYHITDIVIIIMTTMMMIIVIIIITNRFAGQRARRTNVLRTNGTFFRSDILGLLTRWFNGLSLCRTITWLSISRTITMSDYVPRHTCQTAPMAYLQAFEADATVEQGHLLPCWRGKRSIMKMVTRTVEVVPVLGHHCAGLDPSPGWKGWEWKLLQDGHSTLQTSPSGTLQRMS